jgi:hypothetical protein
MMTESRYNALRLRVFKLFNILNNRQYEVWVTPATLMTLEQMRDREQYRQEGFANDNTYYSEFQVRRMKVPQIIDLLPNVTGPNDLGFRDANDTVVEIYESIQEYISLWCEMMTNAPEFPTPPTTELRYLETLAYHLFPMYKKIKPFKMTHDINKQMREDEALNRKGLMGLGMLFSYNKKLDDISFVSHLDALQNTDFATSENFMLDRPAVPTAALADSLAKLETHGNDTTEWLFRG